MLAMCQRDGSWRTVTDLDSLSDLCLDRRNLVWAEVDTNDIPDGLLEKLAEEFSLHSLAVEDAVHARQRPKLEQYPDHLFVVFQQLDEEDEQLEAAQIACFIGERWIFALHSGAERTLAEARRRWDGGEMDVEDGAMSLLHTLLDVVVDDYQHVADRLELTIEDLEEIALDAFNAPIQRQIYQAKQHLARLHRFALPAARVLDPLLTDVDMVSEETHHYFRDISDHLTRISEQVRQLDDLVEAVLDLVRGEQTNALNEVIKKLTSWAAIIAVPTLIASVYGMNLPLIPDGRSIANFYVVLGMMAATAGWIYLVFKKKNWL
ncbi:MAG: magnesium transporter CorA family protein [Actinomycetota bacterium]